MNKVVVFDMDGLMFDTEPIYFKANKKTAERLNIPFDYAFYEKHIGASETDFFAAMYRKFPDHNVKQFTIDSKKDVEEFLVSEPPEMKKGLVDLLEYLKENNYKTVVASSSERKLVEKLLTLSGLESYFDGLIGGDEVAESKPHPEIFQKAVERVGNKESDILVLEDSLNGIRAAYSAGYKVVMIPDLIKPTEEARTKTLEIVENLEEILIKIKSENFF
ncbi:MAG: HAD family hydrolase [Alkalibacterium gilvum]|uniref:Haloacid dehalogenase superfamily, subfamily IA, variant 3 with third motif having DD or ED/haloacid dehalogenase superfamily, subfamily IA, variant 1 with third motif having Dx(3-4)D or Dx(3-4)E n=1 Tax=Alkalibacterium gilvum TaxID=1130080 RepID=A0A1H6UL58_9LACT|nr:MULTISPECIES: HAD family phosphatase [Alkalibacterium]MDN6293224.1 HAD family phosphatase [Alkalibacterium sp.]MDN6295270.1 HAD family phosphatase [Alkalibacterium sp.]MDN6730338.1 HAD family phosphatase [Alkalibacterium sp.]SEI93103.1 haloacid dehalogenase superfamily, subfamily IA, variant 3 with third motif having DD or ED/haloacid dehalogenase superfamily, subfamily IA, variant 1 with third motif having Dx(3-4)D or Dx(3-4)E [Alkalibacterium gilvum]HAJ69741.1 HAD family phosphatase [Alka